MTYTVSVELYELYDLKLHWTWIAEEMTLLQATYHDNTSAQHDLPDISLWTVFFSLHFTPFIWTLQARFNPHSTLVSITIQA